MFMTLAVREVDCPAGSLLQSSMLFHTQVNQNYMLYLCLQNESTLNNTIFSSS